MTAFKLTASTHERGLAMRVAGALQDLLAEPPEALTIFEDQKGEAGAVTWRIDAYFPEAISPEALGAELSELLGEEIPAFVEDAVPDLNWVALSQAALPPVKAQRFFVYGSHDRERVPQGPNSILIEAGEAFGTAHHATTYGCLVAIDRIAHGRRFANILDLGCGSGILSIAAQRAWPKARIIGVDIDPQSVLVAIDNARTNGAGGKIRFIAGAGVAAPAVRERAPYDLVIANILAGPLIMLSPAIRRTIAKGGLLVLSGILTREAASVIAAYRAQDFALVTHRRYDGWSALTLAKR